MYNVLATIRDALFIAKSLKNCKEIVSLSLAKLVLSPFAFLSPFLNTFALSLSLSLSIYIYIYIYDRRREM